MPQRLFDEFKNWVNGVNTSASSDSLPAGFSPRARNTTIKMIGEGTARLAKRRGALLLNSTPLTGSPAVVGFQFKQKSGTKTTLLVSDGGRLDKLNSDGTTTVINATGFTAGTHYPIFSVANDLCFIVNDVDQKKFDGTNLTKFGITRPAAPTAVDGGAGGVNGMVGTYDIALSYYNNLTGAESSLSDFTTVTIAASHKVNVSWPAPADPQVTHVRVHIRKQALGASVYRLVAGATPAPDPTTGGFPIATTATVVDIADTTIVAFIILSPTISENNPPPVGAQFPCWHANRMFVADSGNIYYSKIQANTSYPESFDPNNIQPVNPNDGDTIQGMFSMWGRLFIFKRYSLWQLVGTDSNSWNLELVSADHGTSSMRSICSADGVMFWWSQEKGPVAYDGNGLPTNIGKLYVEATVAADQVNQTSLTSVCAGVDESNQTVLWAYPEFGQTRNTRILPFNYKAKRFAAEFWNPFDVYSMWVMETSDHLKALYIGNYAGQAFQWWAAGNDAAPAASLSYAQTVMKDFPLAYWRFEELAGPYGDNTGHGHTIIPGIRDASRNHVSLLGDGSVGLSLNDIILNVGVSTASCNPIALGLNCSFEFWATAAYSNANYILGDTGDGSKARLMLSSGGTYRLLTGPASSPSTEIEDGDGFYTSTVAAGRNHVVCVVTNGVAQFYINGAAITTTVTGSTPWTGLSLSAFFCDNANIARGHGFFDELAVYNYALTASQVLTHYNAAPGTGRSSSGTVTSATSTTLTDTANHWTANELIERYVYVLSADRTVVQRRRITANTTTQITISSAWDSIPNTTYTYVIGAPQFEVDTPWTPSGDLFLKKRYEFFFSELISQDSGVAVDVDFFKSMNDDLPVKTITLPVGVAGGTYDAATSIYDTTKFATTALSITKSRMAFVAKAWKARVRNCQPDQDITIYVLGAQSVPLGVHN